MVQVTELGYMGFGVKDLETWKKFAAEVLAMGQLDEGHREPDTIEREEQRVTVE